ncbi:hypothetical protein OIU77_013984 [Salix suchowensis]|uniref:Uncharacterized protein n=1 Tax=Salix suchowensis TaxID=1278906 RepID=A0ABQ8ZW68_9ROSI|nr:hypothetical protein OIU77_013984 [Salix suchowensis]
MKSVTSIKVASSTLATLSLTVLPRVLSKPPGLEQFKRCHGRLISLPLKVLDLSQGGGSPSEISVDGKKRHHFPDLRGENSKNSLEALVRNTGKESLQWGIAAGVYAGLTYGLRESRGVHDWKNSAVAGAITGVALALTTNDKSHEQIVQCAITGAAITTAANLLTGIF